MNNEQLKKGREIQASIDELAARKTRVENAFLSKSNYMEIPLWRDSLDAGIIAAIWTLVIANMEEKEKILKREFEEL